MKPLITIICLLFAVTAWAGNEYDIKTIIPGQPWQLVVKMQTAPGVPLETQDKYYIAYVNSNPPLVEQTYARFHVEISKQAQGAIRLSLTPEQSKALAGVNGRWVLVYLPDTGAPQIIALGKVEVKS